MGWLKLLGALNRSLVSMLRAEIEALGEELSASGRRLVTGVALLEVAMGIAVIFLATLVFTAIALLMIWLPAWGAALVVAGILALAAAIVAGMGWRRLRSVEGPGTILRRRVDDHLGWWQQQVGGKSFARDERRRERLSGEEEA